MLNVVGVRRNKHGDILPVSKGYKLSIARIKATFDHRLGNIDVFPIRSSWKIYSLDN